MSRPAYYLNRFLGAFGLKLSRIRPGALGSLKADDAFHRLMNKDIPVSTVLDIGASNGCWSEKLGSYYPDCHYHLIEANEIHKSELEEFVKRRPKSSFTIAAASDSVGEIYFDGSDPWGGLAAHEKSEAANRKIPCTSVDEEIVRHKLPAPYLLKLDTHGFEVPILRGAEQALSQTNIIVLESYNFHLTDQSLTFWEMCVWLFERGFRPLDVLEPMHRPKDQAFWQIDIVFARADRPEFYDNRYA